jgi:hypothetical protein
MFESGIGPGVRSDRFGTWALIFFLLLFAPTFFVPVGGQVLLWLLLLACAGTTLGALGCGLMGLFIPEQRRAALHGLLKGAVTALVGGSFGLIFLALAYGNWE